MGSTDDAAPDGKFCDATSSVSASGGAARLDWSTTTLGLPCPSAFGASTNHAQAIMRQTRADILVFPTSFLGDRRWPLPSVFVNRLTRRQAGSFPVPLAVSASGKIHSSRERENSIIDVVKYGVSVFRATKKIRTQV